MGKTPDSKNMQLDPPKSIDETLSLLISVSQVKRKPYLQIC